MASTSYVSLKFQSSPSPKAGSYSPITASAISTRCFNPLPARRPGATVIAQRPAFAKDVSILSQPEGRELRYLFHAVFVVLRFQSSPSPKAGSYLFTCAGFGAPITFQSSPSPKAGSYFHP